MRFVCAGVMPKGGDALRYRRAICGAASAREYGG